MSKQTITTTHWFRWWGWQTEIIESWLEEKAAQGWHVVSVDCWLMRFRFVRDTPKQIRYCADYQSGPTAEYQTIFEDAGWNLVSKVGGWYIWRMEYEGDRPQIFSDVDSLIGRNNRLIGIVAACLSAQTPLMVTLLTNERTDTSLRALFIVSVLLSGILAFGLLMLIIQNKGLKARKR